MQSIVTIGGGTGQFTLLSGLKKYPVSLTAIVTMADNGGSTGLLRDELGVLPPGDIRQCLVALSEADVIMRELFNYRYDNGGLKGHNFGNIFLSTLEKLTGSFEEAVRVSSLVLATRGTVIPVATDSMNLLCGEGATLKRGEHEISDAEVRDAASLRLEPVAYANPKAVAAIEAADCIVIGPGNLFWSIVPNLLVKGISDAIARSRARVVYNCNLMTTKGHTDTFNVADYVNVIESYIGKGRLDFVTFNRTRPSDELLERYALGGTYPVLAPEAGFGDAHFVPLAEELISATMHVQKTNDAVKRSLIRHDSERLARVIIEHCLDGLRWTASAARAKLNV